MSFLQKKKKICLKFVSSHGNILEPYFDTNGFFIHAYQKCTVSPLHMSLVLSTLSLYHTEDNSKQSYPRLNPKEIDI